MTTVLVDTGPDMREQLLTAGIRTVDGVIYTHAHADHIHGIDDLRMIALNQQRRVDIHADWETSKRLHQAFGYCFTTPPGSSYPPILEEHRIMAGGDVSIDGAGGTIMAKAVRVDHGDIDALAFRIGGFLYCPDVLSIPDDSLHDFTGLDTLVLDALRPTPHPSHLSLSDALGWIDRLKPRRAILTNMHIDMDYQTLRDTLPLGVEPAYDGMTIEITFSDEAVSQEIRDTV